MTRYSTAVLFTLMALTAMAGTAAVSEIVPPQSSTRAGQATPISFLNDIEPILTRAGCNAGSCHGQQFGKGGFKLSLAGYDPDLDYENIVRAQNGRRTNCADPTNSLLLKKPALLLPHQGGLRLTQDSLDFKTLVRWLQQGAPGPNPKDPEVSELVVRPAKIVLSPRQSVQLRVEATYSNGSKRIVTSHTRINSINDAVANSTPDGFVTAAQPGATAIMLRYQGLATVAYVDVPYSRGVEFMSVKKKGQPRQYTFNTQHVARNSQPSFIDRLAAERWKALGLSPSGICTDSEFIRRVSLDLNGTLPTLDEVRAFLADHAPNKRTVLIDRLLDRPEYADYWTLKWSDLLRSTKAGLGAKSQAALNAWLRNSFADNKPYDQFVRELIASDGRSHSVGPVNYYRVVTTPLELTETTAQLFLGIRMQCAKCHHHPFEKWSQKDYYQFAAFFARVGLKPGSSPDEQLVRAVPVGEVAHPKTGERMEPRPLGLDLSERPSSRMSLSANSAPNPRPSMSTSTNKRLEVTSSPPHPLTLSLEADRREQLADWLTSKENAAFARMIVNRYWGHLMRRGIIDPVDDVRVTNPPSNPALLDVLARDFVAHRSDLKHLLRTICNSRVYQLSSQPTAANRSDSVFYSHHLVKRQPAEVLLDSLCAATGTNEKFAGLPTGVRAIQLPDSGVISMFLDTFGRPARSSACECERNAEPSLTQALQMLNGDAVNRKIADPEGRVAKLVQAISTDKEIITELYLASLSRFPTPAEAKTALANFYNRPKQQAAEDLLWALVNTKEFAYIR